MKEIILKWIEMLKEKHKLKYTKCNHEWKEEKYITKRDRYRGVNGTPEEYPTEFGYTFTCSKCGEFKQIEIK